MKIPTKVIEPESENNRFEVIEMKDVSMRQKIIDDIDIVQENALQGDDDSTDLNHSFDERELMKTSSFKAK